MPGKSSKFKIQSSKLLSGSKRKNGFTLVEVLIAIAIIAVVFGVVASSMVAIQKRARDVQRESDLRIIQGALTLYYADRSYYPDSLTLSGLTKLTECDGDDTTCDDGAGTRTYTSDVPQDPSSGTATPYCYSARPNASSTGTCPYDDSISTSPPEQRCHFYRLYAKLEGTTGTFSCGSNNTYSLEVTPLN